MKVSQEQKNEIRKKLLKAAVEIMTYKGFQNSTMREISEKAGFGTATIYNYFPTKEKITRYIMGDRRGSNPQRLEPQSRALPLNYDHHVF